MSNMSHCRMQNTLGDIRDCMHSLSQAEDLSAPERKAAKLMFEEILEFCWNMGWIDVEGDITEMHAFVDSLEEEVYE